MVFAPQLVSQAYRVVLQAQAVSAALLQRRLKIGHSLAQHLLNELIARDVVRYSPRTGHRLDPHFLTRHQRKTMPDPRSLYVDKVVETALFFFECFEENNDGHTGAIKVLKPGNVSNMAIRKRVLHDSYRTNGLSLTAAAIDLHAWLSESGESPDDQTGIVQAIETAAAQYDRPPRKIEDEFRRRHRAFRRLARYYRMIHKHGTAISNDSRVPDYFIPAAWIAMGQSEAHAAQVDGGTHPEHVVPCAFILKNCVDLFEQEWSVDEVAWLLQRMLGVVNITFDERDALDNGENNLKFTMPSNWHPLTGCVYARLHDKNIDLEHACTCQRA
ncbi:DNA translocase FtsK [Noviherbaspirillum galbum]|uniref:FtsK gamma domain-containing protein n=1 Tax=Noviherbaspirillum galbum TaxID=2709383 RepID=A0A6B3SQW1_9BURK|nr:DNA translocase FtsK [Noviherbaspirillum galbum]NEX60049.1 hypothetical protein [Noviherbaspirillum galbum]